MRKEAGQAALVGFASPGDSVIAVRDSAAAAAAPVQRRRYCSSFFFFFASFG
jgi:class 3 adenylate cyclase